MQISLYDYHIFDSRRIKEKIKTKIINVTITSPPYWNLKNYKSKHQIGFGQIYDDYLNDMIKIFKDIYNKTKDNGSLWIVLDTLKQNKEFKLLPFDLANRLTEIDWKLQDIIIWVKDKNLPWSHKGKMRNIFEYILFFTKSNDFKFYIDRIKETKKLQDWWIKYPERYNPKGKVPARLWDFPIPTQGSWSNGWIRHFCPFPPKLAERIILLTTNKNDIVFDPFAGSGVVLAQSKVMSRYSIGFDIKASYKTMYENKVLPYIRAYWVQREQVLINKKRESTQFSSKIKILRQLKYPKILIRKAVKKGLLDLSSTKYVFLFGDKKNMSAKIFLFIDDYPDYTNLNKKLESIMSRPPLSKYGFNPNVQIKSKTDVKNYLKNNENNIFFIYEEGNTHYYKRKISLQKLLNEYEYLVSSKEYKFPHIISNLGVRISQKEQNE
ncbi:MAG: site-specific DNA-methyltransferase [Candidatus Aminicenantes bacterium]|nr:site-specific DNA-methyltransferase [Candidatus Aminicenantes bacterium]